MCPPTQSIAMMPTFASTLRTTGIPRTRPRPSDSLLPLSHELEADVVHLHDQADDAVDADRDRERDEDEDERAREQRLLGHLVERDDHDLGGQDEVGADRAADQALLLFRAGLGRRRLGFRVGVGAGLTHSHSFSAPS